ncbi:MAG: MbnP family protein [Verrucomicrobiales bacterium]
MLISFKMSFIRGIIFLVLCLPGRSWAVPVDIRIRPVAVGRPLLLDSLRHAKSGEETFSVSRLSYLVSGLALQRPDGSWVEPEFEAAWLDAVKRRDSFRVENVPRGRYVALRFAIGLSEQTNTADPASFPAGHPLNPAINKLHWNWQDGYIFLAIEGHYRGAGDRRGYALHFARTVNRTVINLPVGLELNSATGINLDFDVTSLLAAPRPIVFGRDGESTHSRKGDVLAASLAANLPGAFRVRNIGTSGGLPAAGPKKRPLYLPVDPQPFPFKMAATFPLPRLPLDNPLLRSRVELGRRIFSDTKLSRDGSLSCASCHHQDKAFTDGRAKSVGIDDRTGTRNSMPLFNLAWKEKFFWDGRAPSLRAQVLMPIESHSELDESLDNVVAKFSGDPGYPPAFKKAFASPGVSAEKIALALESFLLTLTSYDSKFDRAMAGKAELTMEEKRGLELFMTEYEPRSRQFGADCFHCHGGALFSDHDFHNNGLKPMGEDDGIGGGRFSTPSLRNVALTAPYMHDGRFSSLEEVVAHYNSVLHRSGELDANLAKHPEGGLGLTKSDEAALVAFLRTLTDPKYGEVPLP